MLTVVSLIAGTLVVASVPYWLPATVVALRMRLLTRINGDEGIAIPGPLVDAAHFKPLYAHPAAGGRSRGAALSDLFWYWLSPGPAIHQEHVEAGDRYDEIARTTRRILAVPRTDAEARTRRAVARGLGSALGGEKVRRAQVVRLRDVMMPIWAEFYYELVFGQACPPAARQLIVDNANDVVTALKCCGLRHMETRHRLTRFLVSRLRAGDLPHVLPACLSVQEQALYLQGVFFNTAIVQASEAMVHLLLVVAQHEQVQAALAADPDDDEYVDHVIDETFRIYPLFGISHRITTAEIALDEQTTIPKGSVLCFNHPAYHRTGFEDPERFDPDRWGRRPVREANYIPFGVATNRPCPASGLVPVTMRAATRALLARFTVYSSASHTRSIPHRGPCVLVSRVDPCAPQLRRALLLVMRVRDRWEDVWRGVVQLVFGTYMVWDARRLRLCGRYFDAQDDTNEDGADRSADSSRTDRNGADRNGADSNGADSNGAVREQGGAERETRQTTKGATTHDIRCPR